jgi:hypothetical protein
MNEPSVDASVKTIRLTAPQSAAQGETDHRMRVGVVHSSELERLAVQVSDVWLTSC